MFLFKKVERRAKDMTENGFVKECWDGLNIEEFTFSDIEKHIDIQARSGGGCCCEIGDMFTTQFC